MSFESDMQAHLERYLELDREAAEAAIRWYYATCPWLKPLIGPALSAKWREVSGERPVPDPPTA